MEQVSQKRIEEFLKESNAIEGIYDNDSLTDSLIAWEYLIGHTVLSKAVVLETHRLLMEHQPLEEKYKGAFRDIDVWVARRKGMNPSAVPFAVGLWARKSSAWGLERVSKDLHVMYEKIHPFVDGNGRTGRMFMNWTRLRHTKEPFLIIKESERQEYYKWFRE